ncbi:hypothetical protein FNF27_01847 [Cafeteria roenbergensis]|uniref:BTB domain-containing protein n=1 Tax=Cafeteria roenbergensis TaxID=33653 RepID=A0A5A8EFD5_CAFRO|nr:hypothetical protein FNF27_01847 [Cafeteria roenbergensis]
MVAVGSTLYAFGGNDKTRRFNDLHALDSESYCWATITPAAGSEIPCMRTAHAATTYAHFMIIFGGWNGERELDDVFSFDTEALLWRELKGSGPGPSGRHFPALAVVRKQLMVFGGFNGTHWCNDVHVMNLETLAWTKVDLQGPAPTPRASATAVAVPGDRVIVFGGFDGTAGSSEGAAGSDFRDDAWVLHTVDESGAEAFAWEALEKPTGRRRQDVVWPPPSSGHSATAVGSHMVVFGGRSSEKRFNGTFALNSDTMVWTELATRGQLPCPRKTQAMACVGSRVFVVGGHNGGPDGWLDDCHILHVGSALRSASVAAGPLAGFMPATAPAPSPSASDSASLRRDLCSLLDLDLTADLLSPPPPLDGSEDTFGPRDETAAAAFESIARRPTRGAAGLWPTSDDQTAPRDPVFPGLRAGSSTALPLRRTVADDWGSRTQLGDVTFVVQGRRIALHKCVLAARSEYYRQMFTCSMAEAVEAHPVIPLVDVPIPIFLALIRYIYADQLPPRPVRDRLVPGLLQQAQRLGIVRLSVLCQQHLASRLSVHNAVAMLDAADTHGAIPLRRAAFAFVLDNFAAVSRTLAFLQLRADLLRHIMWRRARRRSKPQDRRALTWDAVEQGLDDANRSPEVVFELSSEEDARAAAAQQGAAGPQRRRNAAKHVALPSLQLRGT